MSYIPELKICSIVLGLCGGLATSTTADVTMRDETERTVSVSVAGTHGRGATDLLSNLDCTAACSLRLDRSHECAPIVPQSAFYTPKGLRAETMPPELARRWAESMVLHYPPANGGWFANYGQHVPALVSRLDSIVADAQRCR